MYDLAKTPLEGCRDMFVHGGSSSLGSNYAIPNPIEHSHVSLMCSQHSSPPKNCFEASNENPMFSDSNVDLGHEENMFNILGGNVINLLLSWV